MQTQNSNASLKFLDEALTYCVFEEYISVYVDTYEYLTAFRDEKRATLSLLLPTPQDPTEDASMTESFLLTLYFNTLHVRFHVDALEVHQ
jgi:hypothetical protein